ncbi:hypothetical protein A2881_04895 [Candidatus Peribacteria bacterium RIFCSPHIGHO2_01_FULL_55_13]|nr:MAG: hypothetical protein A2881_04895 [Candidatus Peribacteria bacterium RIFCSPHIGHO2_01_FULL_55_13]OGJ65572.1 MAG: hypothetical protein A3F36_03785 [Candidatus Peribacteria bacterium RIFCSPHIGHO2_12_FULL_55_11]
MSPSNSSLIGKTILLVSTGSVKKKFILDRMKEIGLNIVAIDETIASWAKPYLSGEITFARGTALAEIVEKTASACASYNVDGAITFWEEEIPLLAHICKACGFTGNTVEAAMNTRDKFLMQEILKAHGEPHIPHQLLHTHEDLRTAMKTIGFPAVIKPLFGADSLSVIRVNDEREAERAYTYVLESFQHPYEKLYIYDRGVCVYQKFVDGQEFSVECCCQNGTVTVVGMHEKMLMSPPFFVETGDYLPPMVTDQVRSALETCAMGGLKALGVRDSLSHVEIKWTKRGPQIIEAASRMGGDYTYIATRVVYGADLVQAGCEIALGIPVSTHSARTEKYVTARYWIPNYSGVITEFSTDGLPSFPGVEAFDLSKRIGDTILVPPKGYENAGWIVVSGATPEEATERMSAVIAAADLRVRPL